MYISDTLSRAALPILEINPQTPDYVIFRLEKKQESREEIEETNMEECLFTTDERSTKDWQRHSLANSNDQDYSRLAK